MHVVHLGGREQLEVHVRQRLVKRARQVDVVAVLEVRALAAHHVDLAVGLALVHLDGVADQVADVPRVGAGLLAGHGERAELALHPTHVRVVEVQVVDEVDLVGAAAQAARGVRQLAQRGQVVGLQQRDPVVEVETLTGEHLLTDRGERIKAGGGCHARRSLPAGGVSWRDAGCRRRPRRAHPGHRRNPRPRPGGHRPRRRPRRALLRARRPGGGPPGHAGHAVRDRLDHQVASPRSA